MVSRLNVGSSSFLFRRRGFTLVEIIMVVVIIALLASIAIPSALRARAAANEAAAMGNLRSVVTALEMYRTGGGNYPAAWQDDLYAEAEPDFGPPQFDLEMDDSEVQGYRHTYTAQPDGCTDACSGFVISSVPATYGQTGSRAFFVDHTGVIRHCAGEGPADATDGPMHFIPAAC